MKNKKLNLYRSQAKHILKYPIPHSDTTISFARIILKLIKIIKNKEK